MKNDQTTDASEEAPVMSSEHIPSLQPRRAFPFRDFPSSARTGLW